MRGGKIKVVISRSHRLMLLLMLAADKDATHNCKVPNTSQEYKIEKMHVNDIMVRFEDGYSYKTEIKQLLTPNLVRQIVGPGVLIKDNALDSKKHQHVYPYNDGISYHETNETIFQKNRRYTPSIAVGPEIIAALNSIVKTIAEETESDTNMQLIRSDGSIVTAYDPTIVSCEIKEETLRIKLDEGEKHMSVDEFRQSRLRFGLVYKDSQIEYVLVRNKSLQCMKIKPAIKNIMKHLSSAQGARARSI